MGRGNGVSQALRAHCCHRASERRKLPQSTRTKEKEEMFLRGTEPKLGHTKCRTCFLSWYGVQSPAFHPWNCGCSSRRRCYLINCSISCHQGRRTRGYLMHRADGSSKQIPQVCPLLRIGYHFWSHDYISMSSTSSGYQRKRPRSSPIQSFSVTWSLFVHT